MELKVNAMEFVWAEAKKRLPKQPLKFQQARLTGGSKFTKTLEAH